MDKASKEKHYTIQRSEDIISKYDLSNTIDNLLGECYKLGQSTAYGTMLYMLESNDFDKESIRKFIIKELKNDTQMRCDAYGVWSELKMKFDKE